MLILASASPRRAELLKEILTDFRILPSAFAEGAAPLSARETARTFAEGKAREVFRRFPEEYVLGADTVVSLGGRIFGKPHAAEDAFFMLSALSGNTHSVFTGVCLVGRNYFKSEVAETRVTFRSLSRREIEDYIRTFSPFDKAGAYGIQDGELVERWEGSYSNVVGLPVELTKTMLEECGLC